MTITVEELKENLDKYLELSKSEDILVTKDGKPITTLTSPFAEKMEILHSLAGVLETDMTLKEAREERLAKKVRSDSLR